MSGKKYAVISHDDITKRKFAENDLKMYTQRLLVLEEELRGKIAMDLHDDISQVLTAIGLNLAHLKNQLKGGVADSVLWTVEDTQLLTKEVSRSVRDLMVELHPYHLDEDGLAAAIRAHLEPFLKRSGIEAAFTVDPKFPSLATEKEAALFRITQEALNNVIKHAAAKRVTIFLSRIGKFARLTITDDGKGFTYSEAAAPAAGSGWGLNNMRHRVELIGGSFRVHSVLGQGTTVDVTIKLLDNSPQA